MNGMKERNSISNDPQTEHFREHLKRDPYLLLHKSLYFLSLGAGATYYPFLVLHLVSIGLTEEEAGRIMAVGSFTSAFMAPMLSNLADQSEGRRRSVLLLSYFSAVLSALTLPRCRSFWSAMIGVLLVDISTCAIFPIVDASLIQLLKSSCEGQVML